MEQSSLVRWGTRLPCLSFTMKNTLTRLTLSLRVSIDSSLSGCAGAVLAGGGASGEGASCADTARGKAARPSRKAALRMRDCMLLSLDALSALEESTQCERQASVTPRASAGRLSRAT